MGLASTEATDQGDLAVLGVVTEGELMRQECLTNAIQNLISGWSGLLRGWRIKEKAAWGVG